jgi:toxin-antitoxin system PIN domain toxin
VSHASLLDVNILVALFDSDHIHHELAHDWFADHSADGWATCAVTENGFVRLLTNPAYGLGAMRPQEIVDRLGRFCASGHHEFWRDTVSLRDATLFKTSLVRGHRQLTDIYLLGLAKKVGGRLATFDRTIPLGAVVGASRDTLQVLSAG